jgi:LacI family transcriptional regulator
MRTLSLPSPPTAVLTSNDYTTTDPMKHISEKGFKKTDDIAVIGFDDRRWMSAINLPLTGVDQPPFTAVLPRPNCY